MRKTSPDPKPLCAIIKLNEPVFPCDFEFKPDALADAFYTEGLSLGRCLGSKSGYRLAHPDNEFVPNANIFCPQAGKTWWGDLDLAFDKPKLEAVARRLGVELFVLSESDGRFENAKQQHSDVVRLAIWNTGDRK